MKFERTEVVGMANAIYGMRNPMNSWEKCDSEWVDGASIRLGENDMKLAKTLSKSGPDHGKYLRMIHVQVQVSAPLYWWKEMDQYKVGTTTNSCSTMHKLLSTPITQECFEIPIHGPTLERLENLRKDAVSLKEAGNEGWKKVWKQLVAELPEGWVQTRMWDANYATLKNIYHRRKGHKLTEWADFLTWIESLPYAKELIVNPE